MQHDPSRKKTLLHQMFANRLPYMILPESLYRAQHYCFERILNIHPEAFLDTKLVSEAYTVLYINSNTQEIHVSTFLPRCVACFSQISKTMCCTCRTCQFNPPCRTPPVWFNHGTHGCRSLVDLILGPSNHRCREVGVFFFGRRQKNCARGWDQIFRRRQKKVCSGVGPFFCSVFALKNLYFYPTPSSSVLN